MSKCAILPVALLACAICAADQQQKTDPANTGTSQAQKSTRRPHIHLGGIMVGAGYTRWSGGWCCGYGPWGYPGYFGWDPFFYSPYYAGGFAWGPNMGEVKLRTDRKDAEVFLDGAYAGTAAERKSMWLDPGVYSLEVRAPGKAAYTKRIYVLSGKSLRIHAKLEARP
jgi:PEGA domain